MTTELKIPGVVIPRRVFTQPGPKADIPAHPLFCRYRGKSKSRQSRKTYKLTVAGIKSVEAMIDG
jgi:hypothetical protein